MQNVKGEILTAGEWYNFGGNVSFRFTGERRKTLYIRCDKTGKISKPSGPASHDALSSALYNGEVPTGYAAYCFGRDFELGDGKASRFY